MLARRRVQGIRVTTREGALQRQQDGRMASEVVATVMRSAFMSTIESNATHDAPLDAEQRAGLAERLPVPVSKR